MKRSKFSFTKQIVTTVAVAALYTPVFAASDVEKKTDAKVSKPSQVEMKKDVTCPEGDEKVAGMMGGGMGMGGGNQGTQGTMGGMGMGGGNQGTQGTMGGMGGMGMGGGTQGTQGTMGGMGGMGMQGTTAENENKDTIAPNGALSHSPCSKADTDDNTQ